MHFLSLLEPLAEPEQQQASQQRTTALENEQKAAAAKQQEVITAAVSKARSEVPSSAAGPSKDIEEIAKKHAAELKALEERLNAAHKTEVEAAVTAATQVTATSTPTAISEDAQKAAVDAAVAAAQSEWKKTEEQALEQAVERGRQEQAMKARLKDSQLLKAQNRVKELEAQLLQQQPATSTSMTTNATQAPVAQAKPATRGGVAMRGRGAARGLAPVLGGRGGAPAAASIPASGVSIMGAAKRPREEGESEAPASENSLAKRLKPAEAKPLPIRRPNVPKP